MKKIDILNKFINDNIDLDDNYDKILGKIEESNVMIQQPKKPINYKMRYAVVILSCILLLIVAIGIPIIPYMANSHAEDNQYIEGYQYLSYDSKGYTSKLNEIDSRFIDEYIDYGKVFDCDKNSLDCEIYSLKGLDKGIAVGIRIYGKDDYFVFYIKKYNVSDLYALIKDFNLTELAKIEWIEDSNKNKINSNYENVLNQLSTIDNAYSVDEIIKAFPSYSISFKAELFGFNSSTIKLFNDYYIMVKMDYITATFYLGEEEYNKLIDIIEANI